MDRIETRRCALRGRITWRERTYPTEALAFWGGVQEHRAIGLLIAVLMGFVNPLIVLAVDDNAPSGALYLTLTALSGAAAAGLMLRAICQHPQARAYAKRRWTSSVLPAGLGIAAVVGGLQIGLLARLFGDTSAQTFYALGLAIAGLTLLGLLIRAAEAPVERPRPDA